MVARRCEGTSLLGRSCKAYAVHDSEYCFRHDPSKRERAKAAASKGGIMEHVYRDLFPVSDLIASDDPLEISRKLGRLAEKTLRSRIQPARISVAIRAFEAQLKAIALASAIRRAQENDEPLPIVFENERSSKSFQLVFAHEMPGTDAKQLEAPKEDAANDA